MKLWKSSILIICISLMLLSSMNVSAEIDASGDVLHWKGTDWHNWTWNVDDKPNIDITDISYSIEDRLTITMSVTGNLGAGLSLHHLEFNSPDAYYRVVYNPASGTDPRVMAQPVDFTPEDLATWVQPASETPIQGGTLTATVDWITDDHTMTDFYGWAYELNTEDGEAWHDYAPDNHSIYGSYDDYYGNDGNGGGSETPGFEILTLIAAIGIALIVLRNRK